MIKTNNEGRKDYIEIHNILEYLSIYRKIEQPTHENFQQYQT